MFSEKLGMGSLRNKNCPFCNSGKKFKKCKCYGARKVLVSSVIPKESDLKKKQKEIKDAQNNSKDNS